jgi:hypothetical protein
MQTSERPVFRQDLVAEAVEEQGARYIDVADPDSGHMFRFFEVEYALACAMDGQRDVAGIVKWAQEELGLTPSPKEVQTVIATLADLRFIETGATRLSDVPEAKAAAKDVHSEATTVGAKAFPDDELGRGIVVGKPGAAPSSGANVELGNAGATAGNAADTALPKADFDLGAPGAGAAAGKKPAAATEDFALGAPGAAQAKAADKKPAGDLSLDLTADMPVTAAGVKEAVRQSKVMTAVEVPKDLQDELESKAPAKAAEKKPEVAAKPAEKKPAEKAAEKKPAEKAEKAEMAEKKAAEKKPAEKAAEKKPAEKAAEKKPITLPKTPAEKTPVAPPAPQAGISPVLVVLLILAVVGGGAYFFWKLVLDKPGAGETKAPPPKPVPPPPPAEVTAKVTLETPPAQEIKAPAGTIETIEAADKDVRAGDTIATLTGAKALTTELDKLRADIDKATPSIEAAMKELSDAQQKENNEAGVKAAQAKVDRVRKPVEDKKATVIKKQADLDKLTVKTPVDGKLALPEPAPKAGDKVTADQVIAAVVKPTVPVATFNIPAGTKIGADGNVSLNAGGKTVVCTVSDAQAASIKVTCPPDSGLANGADVKFTLPK